FQDPERCMGLPLPTSIDPPNLPLAKSASRSYAGARACQASSDRRPPGRNDAGLTRHGKGGQAPRGKGPRRQSHGLPVPGKGFLAPPWSRTLDQAPTLVKDSLLTRRPGNAGLTKESTARELEARGRSMGARQTGSYETTTVAGETVQCFIPRPLPPEEPPLQLDGEILERN